MGGIDRHQVLEEFESGFVPRETRLVGLEYELLGVLEESGRFVPFQDLEGRSNRTVTHVLERLVDRYGWNAVGTEPLLELERDGSRITLEPGAQIELSARPHRRLADARDELLDYLGELRDVTADLGIAWLPMGAHPLSVPEEIQLLPKERYTIMTRYMPQVGSQGLKMMRASAGMQVNLDVSSPEEAARKLRLALRASGPITALFANSPFWNGKAVESPSVRGTFWLDTDADRCGIPPRLIADGSTTSDYVDWALDAGMYFVEREGSLVDMTGVKFRDFMNDGARGQQATLADWKQHLGTLFPDARLKTYLELRCADGNPPQMAIAYSALAMGLFYGDDDATEELTEILGSWTLDQRREFSRACSYEGLGAKSPDGRTAGQIMRALLDRAARTLAEHFPEDRPFLRPAEAWAEELRSPADELRARFEGPWNRDLSRLIDTLKGHTGLCAGVR